MINQRSVFELLRFVSTLCGLVVDRCGSVFVFCSVRGLLVVFGIDWLQSTVTKYFSHNPV